MIKRAHIQQFLAVVEGGSFTQAAQRLRVTQPTLSSGIADLERMIGARLFVRDRRRVRLTEAGGRFLPLARDIHRGFRAVDSFGEPGQTDWPNLRLGAIRSIPAELVETVVRALNENTGIELIDGSDADLRAAFSQGRIDMTLGLLRPDETGPAIFAIIEEPYVLLASSNHPLAGKKRVTPEELATEIMIARRSCELLDETSRFFTRHQVRPRFALRSDNDERCLRMVAAGLGVTTGPLSPAGPEMAAIAVDGYAFPRRTGLRVDTAWLSPERHATLTKLVGKLQATDGNCRSN